MIFTILAFTFTIIFLLTTAQAAAGVMRGFAIPDGQIFLDLAIFLLSLTLFAGCGVAAVLSFVTESR